MTITLTFFSFINLIILALMAIACAVIDSVLEHRYYPREAPWLYNDNLTNDNPSINGLITWAFALITFVIHHPVSRSYLHSIYTAFKTLYPSLSTSPSNSCERVRRHLFTSTRRYGMRSSTSQRWLGVGIWPTIWDRSSISSLTRLVH